MKYSLLGGISQEGVLLPSLPISVVSDNPCISQGDTNLLILSLAMHCGGRSNMMFYANKMDFNISGDVS